MISVKKSNSLEGVFAKLILEQGEQLVIENLINIKMICYEKLKQVIII